MSTRFSFDNSYARLPERFYIRQEPIAVAAPRLVFFNAPLAEALGLDAAALAGAEGAAIFAGNLVPDGADPLAMAYAGHQFGGFSPRLGDGRALLLGEVIGRDGQRRDIHLKGSGRTPFSRGGDGRAVLGPMLREAIISEAMATLGVPTTRALAVAMTGEAVLRERLQPGAVLARVAASHIRVGSFQYFAARDDQEALKLLADFAIARHDTPAAEAENPYAALLSGVIARQAKLIAQWLHIGFIHGVMNTDNMTISGETIDYGPCAFMDAYDPGTVLSSIDHGGRYAYANQPRMAQWNLARLAETLLPLLAEQEEAALEIAQAALGAFAPAFETAYFDGFARKIGIAARMPEDTALIEDLLRRMAEQGADFTLTFRALAAAAEGDAGAARAQFTDTVAFDSWAEVWRARITREEAPAGMMRATNPAFIPRNHLVEAAIRAAEDRDDFRPFEALMAVLARPFEDQPENAAYASPPKPEERVLATFCGT
ncbi:MAG: YdiU family protein [Roseomonas sp.]|nr:YdiU family protein [Roseomonas sp.]MCA3429994.1 YdiU family protein [Roseomonas sp.]MCA3434395.1 YdiU family protein [Roseomonas sp.]